MPMSEKDRELLQKLIEAGGERVEDRDFISNPMVPPDEQEASLEAAFGLRKKTTE